ncbi:MULTISPECIES: ribonuclease domain-containing protein [unclassified Amycolatopsis]|uniref:ribonuclease domain-containing protein n=1 Tax=unclassified Amycolatopsis TaxID=2618356 RepID=UPI002876EE2B|nr:MULTISPECIES: ribonuclease domain-containing protein [unclassified Amycolatopsis]MDS0136419.1 ribonuclease N [Amycolatopsis sp. 505]MDS0145934.1 ribonuclease N [Amycolatopsis sp. CM201R]
MFNRRRITAALIGLLVLVLGGWLVKDNLGSGSSSPATPSSASSTAPAKGGAAVPGADSGLPVKALSALPPQATDTWKLIEAGGPYPYPRNDDVVFENREKRLPGKKSGYYHEYTVKTPGSPDRGARRLITGQAHELYYTGDHYASFVVVDPAR